MAVLMVLEAPGATTAQYDRANEIMGIRGDADAPDGLIQHVAASDGSSIVAVDVWESEEALGRFFEERLGRALAESGIGTDAKPRILPVHNYQSGAATEAGVLLLVDVDGFTPDLYDRKTAGMDVHGGDGSNHPSVWHAAALGESGGLVVADVWESPEAFGKFAEEEIGPRGAEAGLPQFEPRLIPVHNRMRGKAAQRAA
ncbi:MAG: hypothetical protein QOJ57_63 [Thermoleophilaceae bacterium]|nr:hypothetical protein [Thermoleophilaceae bacterium]